MYQQVGQGNVADEVEGDSCGKQQQRDGGSQGKQRQPRPGRQFAAPLQQQDIGISGRHADGYQQLVRPEGERVERHHRPRTVQQEQHRQPDQKEEPAGNQASGHQPQHQQHGGDGEGLQDDWRREFRQHQCHHQKGQQHGREWPLQHPAGVQQLLAAGRDPVALASQPDYCGKGQNGDEAEHLEDAAAGREIVPAEPDLVVDARLDRGPVALRRDLQGVGRPDGLDVT